MAKRLSLRDSHIFHDYYSRLKEIALSVFEWEGLPDTCNARFLEDTLFHNGAAVFVCDPEMSYLNMKVVPSAELNPYNEPVAFRAFSTGYDREFRADECVYIRNNYLDKSTESTIILYAEKLTEIDISATVNIKAQKTPVLIRCEEKMKTSLQAVYNQYENNAHVIFGHKSLQERPLEVLRTDAPFVADKLREEKRAVWNEALEFLGLNTNPSDKKKERLIISEVDANNEQIDIQAECMLLTRQDACRKINEMFGLNVSVKRRVHKEPAQEEGGAEWHGTQSN